MQSLLIIDDDEDMGDALLILFTDEGYHVRLATSGQQGIDLAQSVVPQVILLDWQMPQVGGRQVLMDLASRPALSHVPVILMSANIVDIPADILLTRKHLSKPFNIDVLLAAVAHEFKAQQ